MSELSNRAGESLHEAGLVPGRHWHALADGRLQCDICPRECKLKEGQRGLCFVRARSGDEIVLTTYGRSSGFCVDPIEKKPLNHFLPGTPVLSFGTAGCNLNCRFCQNWDISKSREVDTLADAALPEALAETAAALGCRSIAYTYNDPVIFHEYAIDTAIAARERGIESVAVSAGYHSPAARAEFYEHMSAANIDLKGFTERFYRQLTGSHLAPVLETLEYLVRETRVWVEVTTLLIPGENDAPDELEAMTQWLFEHLGPDVPLHFTAFHPDYRMRDKGRTPSETLVRARETALAAGMRYVFTGNVHGKAEQSTYCPHCGAMVIGRDWYELSDWRLTQTSRSGANCGNCGGAIAGVFEARPGTWGARRQPVRLSNAV